MKRKRKESAVSVTGKRKHWSIYEKDVEEELKMKKAGKSMW